MALASLIQGPTPDLIREIKKLRDTRDQVAEIARGLKMEPYFAAPIKRIDGVISQIEVEISRRSTS